jgi:hypothetical protein
MAGRGAQTFKKRQKEQQRKEKQQEKFAKRLERKRLGPMPEGEVDEFGEPIVSVSPEESPDSEVTPIEEHAS